MRRKLGFTAVLLGVFSIMVSGVLAAVNWIGTDDALYYELQMEVGILDAAGISEEDLLVLDGALADCLKGNPNAFQVEPEHVSAIWPLEVEVFGEVQPAFNARELTHMEDCRQLFILLRQVRNAALAAGLGLLVLGAPLCRDRRWFLRASWIAPLALLVPLALFALWAAADFNSAFSFFHKLLFTNDLWLLNPETDLLIRICPASMFANMGLRIGAWSAGVLLGVPALLTLSTKLYERKRKKDEIPEL